MEYTFYPFKGIDLISFGDHREKIRETLNGGFEEIKRNEFAENTSDYYPELGFFVEYDQGQSCEAIEFTGAVQLRIDGKLIFSMSYSEVRNRFDPRSNQIEEEEGFGITYHDLGFGVTCEYGTDRIESVMFFSREYWN